MLVVFRYYFKHFSSADLFLEMNLWCWRLLACWLQCSKLHAWERPHHNNLETLKRAKDYWTMPGLEHYRRLTKSYSWLKRWKHFSYALIFKLDFILLPVNVYPHLLHIQLYFDHLLQWTIANKCFKTHFVLRCISK